MNKFIITLACTLSMTLNIVAQSNPTRITDTGDGFNVTDDNSTRSFNPNHRDSVADKEIPMGVHTWTVDRRYGDVTPAVTDTLPHLYQNSIFNTGVFGEYNTIGNNYTPRISRIIMDRPKTSEFFFTQPYDFTMKEPDAFQFVNTLSPFTNLSYDNCGDKQNGEDHIDAKFAVNANKRLGIGFDLDYHYARGYYQNQSTSHFGASLFASYIGDKYQMHALFSTYHRKAAENGGITDDNYITHPESYDDQFSENEIPTVLSKNWNRNNSNHLFLSHRYNIGFYKRVALTEAEKKARAFAKASAQDRKQRDNLRNNQDGDDANGNKRRNNKRTTDPVATGRPDGARIAGDLPKTGEKPADPDSTRIQVTSQQMADSLLAVQHRKDSLDANTKRIYVPVTSFIHTLDINSFSRINQAYASPAGYYANTYYKYDDRGIYGNDSIYDQTKYLSVKNTFAVALMEGFNKYAKAGLKAFVSYDHRKYQMPDLLQEGDEGYYMRSWSEGLVSVGGQLSKTQGRTLHYNLDGEFFLTGSNAGSVSLNFNTDVNFPLFGDTVRLAAKAHFDRITPTFFQRQYHSKHLWWDNGDMSKEIRSGIEGIFTIDKTHTQLRVAVEEIKNYTYFGMEYAIDENHNFTGLQGGVYQEGGNINLLTAQLRQNFKLGPLHWENIVTYQNSSNKDVLPVPTVNIFTNLFFKFLVVKQLTVELGADATFFTKYYAPDYLPQIGQFAVQKNVESRVELGGYPFVDVYANMHLKRTRFFVMMSHVNKGMGNKMMFLAPHYPQNGKVLRIGVSWNFYN